LKVVSGSICSFKNKTFLDQRTRGGGGGKFPKKLFLKFFLQFLWDLEPILKGEKLVFLGLNISIINPQKFGKNSKKLK
jgi:hypothetical protein